MGFKVKMAEISVMTLGKISTLFCVLFGRFRRRTAFPQLNNPILELAAVDLAEKIRNKELRSQDVVEAYIARIKEVNPLINAIAEERFEDAMEDARKVDEIVDSKPKDWILLNMPLLGVPVTIKENCSLGGLSGTTGMTLQKKGIKCEKDGDVVANLKAAGCITLLVSTTPEYCCYIETNNLITGRTVNPYDNRRTPGGSSGGEGALLGAGASVIGLGSDIGGSVRIPALFNGVFAHKPTARTMSLEGHFPKFLSNSDVVLDSLIMGPMCRYAKDLPAFIKIICGEKAMQMHLDESVDIKSLKVFHLTQWKFDLSATCPVDNDIKNCIEQAVEFFKTQGVMTEKAQFNNAKHIMQIGDLLHQQTNMVDCLSDQEALRNKLSVVFELLKAAVGLSKYSYGGVFFHLLVRIKGNLDEKTYETYDKLKDDLKKEILDVLGENGVLILPTFPTPAFRNGDAYAKMAGILYCMIFNILGLPATHVPLGLNKNGLPVGIQVVAAPYQDRLCFEVARVLEAEFGGWKIPK